jgi:hypothetical protein
MPEQRDPAVRDRSPGATRSRRPDSRAALTGIATAARRDWLAASLLTAGLILRLLTLLAYRPVLFYIDTIRYLYHAGGNDPVGYRVPLRLILLVGNLNAVAVIQHMLGLAMAITLYLTLVRRGTPRWLAAIAIAPILLDAYQLQIEQTIMPDVWFEALIVAGLAALLAAPGPTHGTAATTPAPGPASDTTATATAPARRPASGAAAPALGLVGQVRARLARANARSGLPAIVAAGLILGASATVRQVGEILILPALIYLIVLRGGWRRQVRRSAALIVAFVLPILAYSTAAYVATGHFWLSHSGVTTTYGRMAAAADCATLRLPAIERALCPTAAQRALGPDGLEHSPLSPRIPYYVGPLGAQASRLVANFNHAVLFQQPGRVLAAIARDSVKLFALTRDQRPGDAPISRWQFQTSYPYFAPHASRQVVTAAGARFGGGQPTVWRPVAEFLRSYQRDGGYTPGPFLALCVLAGLAGSVLACWRRIDRGRRRLALACLLFFGAGVFVLGMSDVFEFSWRYQLPALVTLPPAGVLAVAAFAWRRVAGQDPGAGRLAESGKEVSLRD